MVNVVGEVKQVKPGAAAAAGDVDAWASVSWQRAAVEQMRAAVASPVHAYMFVGPRGAGKRALALAFASELLVQSDSRAHLNTERAERHRRLALQAAHPDMFMLDPSGNHLRVEAEAATLVAEACRTPVECSRKVLIVNRFHTATAAAAASLLKPLEEPIPTTVWVLLAEQVLPEHVTIASRCVQVDFVQLTKDDVAAVLVTENAISQERADAVAASSNGNLERARILAADKNVEKRRSAWWSVPDRLDGTGASVAVLVDQLCGMIADATAALDAEHKKELASLAEHAKKFGTNRVSKRGVEERHRREHRQQRTDELRFGLLTLTERYRSELAVASNASSVITAVDGIAAIDRIRLTSEELIRNPNESLALQALFLSLNKNA